MTEMVLLENGSGKNPGIMLRTLRHSAGIDIEALFRTGTVLPLPGTGLSIRHGQKISHATITDAEIIVENPSFIRMKITALPD